MSTSGFVDLRSDTLTHPTPAMRRAMADAEVGDDQYGEDPTVNRLQERAAELLGMEAALLMPSGTMGNLVALLTHCGRGDGAILGDQSHIYRYEVGGGAALGGVFYNVVPNDRQGQLDLDQVADLAGGSGHDAQGITVVCIENTHNRCGGTVLSRDYLAALRSVADAAGVSVHMDGARVFNAAAAQSVQASEITAHVDSVQFCLSKALAAPVGSMLAGSEDFIRRARKMRQQVGGAMRQAGVIAAAGLVALNEMRERLPEDHERARRLAEGLATIPGVDVDLATVQTNIVRFRPPAGSDYDAITARFREDGILISGFGTYGARMVTHYEIDDEGIDRTLIAANRILGGAGASVAAR